MNQKRKPYKLSKNWRGVCYIISILLLIIAGVCAGILIEDFQGKHSDQMAFEEIADTLYAENESESEIRIPDNMDEIDPDWEVLAAYRKLAKENPDMIGWIQIEGTTVNYPVMYTPDQPSFYLKRNFYKEYSDLGTPFLQETCDPDDSNNLILYGHHMIAGGMFSDLDLYKEEAFWKESQVIHFDTLKETAEFEVFSVIVVDLYSPRWFRFYEYTDMDEEAFVQYVEMCRNRSIYDTGVIPDYGDQLLTLVTCEYSSNNGRLIVVAKEINKEGN